jgi:hypothetical protein
LKKAAELRLELRKGDTRRRPLHVIVGVPQRHPKQDWYCPVRLNGLYSGEQRIFGVDSWHALMIALRFVEVTLRIEVRRGAQLFWLGRRVSVGKLFAVGMRVS